MALTAVRAPPPVWQVPRDPNFPTTAVQCGLCGGTGCADCHGRGWLAAGDKRARRCLRCDRPLRPDRLQVYCSVECAKADV